MFDVALVARHHFGSPPLGDWQMARALAAHGRVLYVDPPMSYRASVGVMVRGKSNSIDLMADGLRRVRPLSLPRVDSPWWGALGDSFVGRQIASSVETAFTERPVLLSFDPRRGRLPEVSRRMLVYWRRDRFAAMETAPYRRRLVKRDRELMKEADLVCCTTPGLVEEVRGYGVNALHIPNGCDVEHFRTPRGRPADLGETKHIAVFAGGALWRIDAKLIASVADLRPNWTFIFLGAKEGDIPRRGNIRAVAYRPYSEVPAWLQHADVGIIPYDASIELNRDSFPLKALEYLAAGIPVVATEMPMLAGFSPWILRAGSPSSFVDAMERAAFEGPSSQECQNFAAAHSWDSRAEQLREAIETSLSLGRG